MAAIVLVVAVNTGLVAYWGWTAFGVAAEVKSEVAVLQDTSDGLDPQVAYHKSLEQESKIFESREEMLGTITSGRISWTQQVDELVDLVHDGGDDEREYLVWLDDLTVEMKENSRAGTWGTMKASGHSGSEEFADVANFLEDVEFSPLAAYFQRPAPPQGRVSSEDKELIPSIVYDFPLTLQLKDPKERGTATEEKEEGQ
jgi:hypothetical protein